MRTPKRRSREGCAEHGGAAQVWRGNVWEKPKTTEEAKKIAASPAGVEFEKYPLKFATPAYFGSPPIPGEALTINSGSGSPRTSSFCTSVWRKPGLLEQSRKWRIPIQVKKCCRTAAAWPGEAGHRPEAKDCSRCGAQARSKKHLAELRTIHVSVARTEQRKPYGLTVAPGTTSRSPLRLPPCW